MNINQQFSISTMINIGIIHEQLRYDTKNPIKIEEYNKPYSRLLGYGKAVGAKVFIGSPKQYEKGVLKKAVYYDSGWKIRKNVKIDVIFNKSKTMDFGNIPVLNYPEFSKIANDKKGLPELFPNIMPRSFLVNNIQEAERMLPKIRTNKIVIKPRRGSGGVGVKILDKLPEKIEKNTILQEFVESKNVPFWETDSNAWDLRNVIIDGKLIDSFIRIAKKGSLLSNINRGGKIRFIKKSEIPEDVWKKICVVESKFRRFKHRIYSIDFILDPKNNAWMIETNAAPGIYYPMAYPDSSKERKFYISILESLKKTYEESK